MQDRAVVYDNEEIELYERERYRSESHVIPDKPYFFDFVWASLVSVVVATLHWIWHYPAFHIALYHDFAIAAGIRPPETISPGVWRSAIHGILSVFPFDNIVSLLAIAGWAASAVTAFLLYFFIRETLAVHSRQYNGFRPWRRRLAPAASAVGVLLFLLADPVWTAFDVLSPIAFNLFLVVLAAFLMTRFLRLGKSWRLFASMFLFGFAAGESILCLGLMVMSVIFLKFSEVNVIDDNADIAAAHSDPTPYGHSGIFCFIGFLISSIISANFFSAFGGMDAGGYSSIMLAVLFLAKYFFSIFSLANIWGLLVCAVTFIVPFVLAVWFIRAELDDETKPSFGIPIILSVAFLIALTQLTCFPFAWCWTWNGHVTVKSSEFLCICSLLSSIAAALILGELFFRFCVRHYETGETKVRAGGKPLVFAGTAVLLALLLTVPGRYKGMQRETADIIHEYVREVVYEADDAEFLISNGALDDAVEFKAYTEGRKIKAISMMSGQSTFEKYVRSRGASSEEERTSMEAGAITILENWKNDSPETLNKVALQEGFVVWQRKHLPMPSNSGLLARPGGFMVGKREIGIAATRKLAGRIVDLCGKSVFNRGGDELLNDKLLYIMWNMIRMANLRAKEADKAGDYEGVKEEIAFAERLEKLHPSLEIIKEELIKTGRLMLKRLTPRQNLQLALESADFSSAKSFAEIVIKSDPGNPDANFALAMYYMSQEVYSLTAEYLEKCVRVKPRQPAFLNNLALAYLMLGQLEKAEIFARKALDVYPESPEVADTFYQVELAISKRKLKEGTTASVTSSVEKPVESVLAADSALNTVQTEAAASNDTETSVCETVAEPAEVTDSTATEPVPGDNLQPAVIISEKAEEVAAPAAVEDVPHAENAEPAEEVAEPAATEVIVNAETAEPAELDGVAEALETANVTAEEAATPAAAEVIDNAETAEPAELGGVAEALEAAGLPDMEVNAEVEEPAPTVIEDNKVSVEIDVSENLVNDTTPEVPAEQLDHDTSVPGEPIVPMPHNEKSDSVENRNLDDQEKKIDPAAAIEIIEKNESDAQFLSL